MIAFVVFMIFILLSKYLNSKAYKTLSNEKKLELSDLFSNTKVGQFALMIGIVIIYFMILKFDIVEPFIAVSLFFIVILIVLSIQSKRAYTKLKKHDFPDTYIKTYLWSVYVNILGMLMFFLLLTL